MFSLKRIIFLGFLSIFITQASTYAMHKLKRKSDNKELKKSARAKVAKIQKQLGFQEEIIPPARSVSAAKRHFYRKGEGDQPGVIWKRRKAEKNDKKRLEESAKSYGNKVANLEELVLLAKEYNKKAPSFKVAVPAFIGVSDNQIKEFLKKQDFKIAQEWQKLVNQEFKTAETKVAALQARKLPQSFLEGAEKLAKQIEEKIAQSERSLFNKKIKAFITQARENKQVLMVRSTGKEDSEECSNAGGNESVANVQPDEKSVLKALAQVVASYVKPKSLEQRILTQDATIFDTPFTPVLLQVMVGEPNNGYDEKEQERIPCCGVMYTQEQQGKASGVMHLEVTYGNNEAVVDPLHQAKVACDSYYVGKSKVIHSSIKSKQYRLVPKNGHLDYCQNPEALHNQPALTLNIVEQLFDLAQTIEKFYRKPQDVEFLVDQAQKIIYLVQARPNQKRRFTSKPQYITSLTGIAEDKIIKGSTVIMGDASVGLIDNKNQIIVASTLSEALEQYQKNSAAKYAVIEKPAGQLSHEAAILSGENVKTLLIPDATRLKTLLEQKECKFFIDFQRGVIVEDFQSVPEFKTIQDLVSKKFITENWFNHPIKANNSLVGFNAQKTYRGLLEQVMNKFSTDSSSDNSFLDPKNRKISKRSAYFNGSLELKQLPFLTHEEVAACFETLKERDAKTVEETLVRLLSHVYANIYEQRQLLHKSGEKENKLLRSLHAKHLHNLTSLFQEMLASANEVLFTFRKLAADQKILSKELTSRSMERLYPVAQLEKLFLQEADGKTLYAHSLATLQDAYQESKKFIEKVIQPLVDQKQLSSEFVADEKFMSWAQEGVECALTPELEQAWVKFLGLLHAVPAKHKEVAVFMEKSIALDVLPTWINTTFAAEWTQGKAQNQEAAVACFEKFYAEYQDSEKLLTELLGKKQALEKIEADLSVWQDPKQVEVQWPVFKETMVDYFSTGLFSDFKQFEALSPFAKNTTISTMKKMVDIFDSMIKSMKGSTQYQPLEKLAQFKAMLTSYARLLENWIILVFEGKRSNRHLTCCINAIKCALVYHAKNLTEANQQLLPSPRFNVGAIAAPAFAGIIAINRHFPSEGFIRCEDAFTLTHQLLLQAVSILVQRNTSTVSICPPVVEQIEKELNKVKALLDPVLGNLRNVSTRICTLVGSTYKQGHLERNYVVPVRNHGVSFEIAYAKRQPDIAELSIKFVGQARDRWDNIREFIEPFCWFNNYTLKNFIQNNLEISFTLLITMHHNNADLKNAIANMIAMTFDKTISTINLDTMCEQFIQTICSNTLPNFIDRVKKSIAQSKKISINIGKIFTTLIKKGQFDEIFDLVKQDIVRINQISYVASQILAALINKGQFVGTLDLVKQDIVRTNKISDTASRILVALINKGQFDGIFDLVKQDIMRTNQISDRASQILVALIKKNQFDGIFDLIKRDIARTNEISFVTNRILDALINKDQFVEIFDLIKQNIENNNHQILDQANFILIALINKGKFVAEILCLVKQEIKRTNQISEEVSWVLEVLIKNDKFVEEILCLAKQEIEKINKISYGIDLVLGALINKGQFAEILDLAKQKTLSSEARFQIFNLFVKNQQKIGQIKILEVKNCLLDFITQLKEKTQCIEQEVALLEKAKTLLQELG